MNQQWVDEYNKKFLQEREELRNHIIQELKTYTYISEESRNSALEKLNNKEDMYIAEIDVALGYLNSEHDISIDEYKKWKSSLKIDKCVYMFSTDNPGDRLLDKMMTFDGDIIITDPCYLSRKNEYFDFYDEEEMVSYGIKHYMFRDTLYGDWSCTTFDLDTKNPIGQFCADSGNVGVFLFDEVLRYNPDFDCHIKAPWTTTLIKDFPGIVQFLVKQEEGEYRYDTDSHKKGDKWIDYCLEVEGHGVNKVSGESINFVGKQTGF